MKQPRNWNSIYLSYSKIGMRSDKVAQRKNKSRKPKSPKQDVKMSLVTSSPASTSSSESKESPSINDIELIATVDQSDNFKIVDISDIAERCVLEEIGDQDDGEDFDSLHTEQIEQNTVALFPMIPLLKLTIEEEYKICEIEASEDLVVRSLFQTLVESVPDFQESISLFLYSRALGVSFDITTEKVLTWMRECKYVKSREKYPNRLFITNVVHDFYLGRPFTMI